MTSLELVCVGFTYFFGFEEFNAKILPQEYTNNLHTLLFSGGLGKKK